MRDAAASASSACSTSAPATASRSGWCSRRAPTRPASGSTSATRCCAGPANGSRATTGVEFVRHDLDEPLPRDLGRFDVVVSSFAIHHCAPGARRRSTREVFDILRPGGRVRERRARRVPDRSAPRGVSRRARSAALRRRSVEPAGRGRTASDLVERDRIRRTSDCFWKWRELAVSSATSRSEAGEYTRA